MRTSLLFDFTVDKATHTVFIHREFEADLAAVWDAFTKPEILDQWWAPKPWMSKTKRMNFDVGGQRVYAMVGPEGQEHWSVQHYTAIAPLANFKFVSTFIDKDENVTNEFPPSAWSLEFSETGGVTKLGITIQHKTLADLEQHIQMGFKEGFNMTLTYLEQLLGHNRQTKFIDTLL